jgi:hypothetical protein
MTNKELQELLKQYPDDAEIKVKAEGCTYDLAEEDLSLNSGILLLIEI